jgi:Arc/MetJ family transcription regulator
MSIQIHNHINLDSRGAAMRTTVTIDDELYNQALELADPAMDKADLFREAVPLGIRITRMRLSNV